MKRRWPLTLLNCVFYLSRLVDSRQSLALPACSRKKVHGDLCYMQTDISILSATVWTLSHSCLYAIGTQISGACISKLHIIMHKILL